VLAVDLVDGLLQIARERASREGLRNVEFRVADAEALQVGETCFDVATVRWGLMYMQAPERALASIHRALKPGGALVIASWVEPSRVPFASLPRLILERYRELSLPSTDGPGLFRHADASSLDAALQRNGFSVDASEEMEVPVADARDGRGIVAWVRELGGPLMNLLGELPQHVQQSWEEDFSIEMERHRVGEMVTLSGVTRITLARASARPPSRPLPRGSS
jgi:SAM-dependent methyltransferase